MRILFYGDSITDAGRNREEWGTEASFGYGYVKYAYPELQKLGCEVINRGISGNRVVDLYARIKVDCWNFNPDLISILIGVNDVWHELYGENGVEIDRFEKVYRMLIEDTLKKLPNVKIVLIEPFVLEGSATREKYEEFKEVYAYAALVKKLAEEYGLYFLPLQEELTERAAQAGEGVYLADGVHPAAEGAKWIAEEWLKLFNEKIKK